MMATFPRSIGGHVTGKIDAYLEGALSEPARLRVARHLRACAECAEEVDERRRALRLTRQASALLARRGSSFSRRPAPVSASRTAEAANTAAVSRARSATTWISAIAITVILVFVGGLIMAAWSLGASKSPNAPKLLPSGLQLSPVKYSGVPDMPTTISNTRSQSMATASSGGDAQTAQLRVVGRAMDNSNVAAVRTLGWNIPSLRSVGLTTTETIVDQGTSWVTVSTVYHGEPPGRGPSSQSETTTANRTAFRSAATPEAAQRLLTPITIVRECRFIDQQREITGCPTDAHALDRARTVPITVGALSSEVHIETFPDHSWTGYLVTPDVLYRVDSTTQSSQAQDIMSAIVVTNDSRLASSDNRTTTSVRSLDDVMQRLDRGFATMRERLVAS